MRKYFPLLIVIATSLVTHFLFFGYPAETVFDEVHFGKFISGYFTREYFFDIHPPLGKLFISGMGYLTDFKPGFSFAEIGQKFPDQTYLWLRFLPAVFGAILPVIIYYLALEIGLSRLSAFAVGVLIVLENSLLVQSRLMLLDLFLLVFGFLSLLCYLKYRRRGKPPHSLWTYSKSRQTLVQSECGGKISLLLLTGIFGALAASVKWTGATFLAIPLILEGIGLLKNRGQIWVNQVVAKAFNLLALPFLIYFAIFAIHLGLLNKSGPGDAFMTPRFQKTLAGSHYASDPNLKPLGVFKKFIELNLQMYRSNATLTATHPYSSQWYTWPLMTRPIYYWNQEQPAGSGGSSRIYFLGNPIIWWASTAAVLYFLASLLLERRKPGPISTLLLGAYFLNLLPFISIKRAMFLYHYLTALIFAVLIMAYLLDGLKKRALFLSILLVAAFLIFLYFSPLSYGLPLTESDYRFRLWFPSWQ